MSLRIPSIKITGNNPVANALERKLAKMQPAQAPDASTPQLPPPPPSKFTRAKRLNLGLAKVEISKPYSQLDHLLGSNNLRDVAGFFKRDGAKNAAKALFSRRVKTVMIPTGFSVARDPETGRILPETDGPIGSVILGEELRKAGKKVVYTIDTPNLPLLKAALSKIHPNFENDENVVIEVFDHQLEQGLAPDAPERAELRQHANDLLDKHGITDGAGAVFSVELPARTTDDRYSNMRGVPINDINSARDELLLAANDRNQGKKKKDRIVVGGVGDGGNEGAMGNRKGIKPALDGSEMKSSVPGDYPVTAWNSNLGAIAVAAVIAQLGNRLDGFPTPDLLKKISLAVLDAGGVDGVTRSNQPGEVVETPSGRFVTGVDGKPIEVHMEDIERLRLIVGQEIKPQKPSTKEMWHEFRIARNDRAAERHEEKLKAMRS